MNELPQCDICKNCYSDRSKKHEGFMTDYCKLTGRDVGQSSFGHNSPRCCPLRHSEEEHNA